MTCDINSVDCPIILVSIHQYEGLGDLSHGMKMARIIAEKFQNYRVVLVTESVENLERFNKKQFRIIRENELPSINNVALKILAPANSWGVILSFAGYHCDRPLIAFWEYNYFCPPLSVPGISSYCLGLKGYESGSGREIGIFIDDDYEEKHKISALPDRKRLEGLPQPIVEKLKVDTKTDHVFLVYASQEGDIERREFIEKILQENQSLKGQEGHRFFFVAPSWQEPVWTEPINSNLLREKDFVDGWNIKVGAWGNQICFYRDQLSPEEFQQILLYSSPQCLITGDQSLSEAISCGKSITYEWRRHKRELLDNFRLLIMRDPSLAIENICRKHNVKEPLGRIVMNALNAPRTKDSFSVRDLRCLTLDSQDVLGQTICKDESVCYLLTQAQKDTIFPLDPSGSYYGSGPPYDRGMPQSINLNGVEFKLIKCVENKTCYLLRCKTHE